MARVAAAFGAWTRRARCSLIVALAALVYLVLAGVLAANPSIGAGEC